MLALAAVGRWWWCREPSLCRLLRHLRLSFWTGKVVALKVGPHRRNSGSWRLGVRCNDAIRSGRAFVGRWEDDVDRRERGVGEVRRWGRWEKAPSGPRFVVERRVGGSVQRRWRGGGGAIASCGLELSSPVLCLRARDRCSTLVDYPRRYRAVIRRTSGPIVLA